MAFQLNPARGAMIDAPDAELTATVDAHLTSQHPGRSHTDDEIMLLAPPVPDRVVTDVR